MKRSPARLLAILFLIFAVIGVAHPAASAPRAETLKQPTATGTDGFILNNELTDFEPTPGLANSPDGGKRPRSSISPTIVTSGGDPVVALGSPGGSTIITTALEILVNDLDFGMTLPQAIAAPRSATRRRLRRSQLS